MTRQPTFFVSLLMMLAACGAADDIDPRSYTTASTLDDGGDDCEAVAFDEIDRPSPPIVAIDPRRSLFETRAAVLEHFTLRDVLHAIAHNGGFASEPDRLHDQLFDTFGEGPGLGFGPHCDDVIGPRGPELNGFPLQCPRQEIEHVGELDEWRAIAIANRFDLAPSNGAHCGEARIVFANGGPGRAFVIFEAQLPNPDPDCGLEACRPIQTFFAGLSTIADPGGRAKQLHAAFVTGHDELLAAGVEPFLRMQNFTVGTGQVRINTISDTEGWTLREFKLAAPELGPADRKSPRVVAVEVPVASNPFGPLFDDLSKNVRGPVCRAAFLDAIAGLMTDDLNRMGVAMPPECLAAESLADGFDNRYAHHLAAGSGAFETAIAKRIEALDPSSGLTPTDIVRRAQFAGACIGCHQHSAFLPDSALGNGVVAPSTLGFVHTSEFGSVPCSDGGTDCFPVSEALTDVFLPHRQAVMEQFLAGPSCCSDDGGIIVGPGHPVPFELDAASVAEADAILDAALPPWTVGGAPTRRAH